MKYAGTRLSKTTRRIVTAAAISMTLALALQSASALGGQPEDELAPLRAAVAEVAARYTEHHPDVVKASSRLAQGEMVVGAWQCIEAVHQSEVPLTTKACASYREGLSAVDLALMGKVMECLDMADLTERARAWNRFRRLSSYYENVTRQWSPDRFDNPFTVGTRSLPSGDWLVLIDVLNRAGVSDGARLEQARFERRYPIDSVDCSGLSREDDLVVLMLERSAAREHLWEISISPLIGYPTDSYHQHYKRLSEKIERCATIVMGWSAADVDLMERLLRGRSLRYFGGPAERAAILETFNRRRCLPESPTIKDRELRNGMPTS